MSITAKRAQRLAATPQRLGLRGWFRSCVLTSRILVDIEQAARCNRWALTHWLTATDLGRSGKLVGERVVRQLRRKEFSVDVRPYSTEKANSTGLKLDISWPKHGDVPR